MTAILRNGILYPSASSLSRSASVFSASPIRSILVRPHVGHEISCGRPGRSPSASRIRNAAAISASGGAVRETRIVSPMPERSSVPMPIADFTIPAAGVPASVTPRCSGHSEISRKSRHACTVVSIEEAFRLTLRSRHPASSNNPRNSRALSTIALALRPYAASAFGERLPRFTPTRTALHAPDAALATSRMPSRFFMLPGLTRMPSAPASSASSASRWSKCMSATTGMGLSAQTRLNEGSAFAQGRAMRTIWQPAFLRRPICARVPSTSSTCVLHIDWTTMGEPPPTATPPTCISLVKILFICWFSPLPSSRPAVRRSPLDATGATAQLPPGWKSPCRLSGIRPGTVSSSGH